MCSNDLQPNSGAFGKVMMANLTIIMPAYNADRYIAQALASVQAQTVRDWQLFVIDDGSTDSTFDVASQIAAKDPRILVTTAPNSGIANVMNRALLAAETEWVACMHADDIMLPHRLERQLAFAAEHPHVAVFSSLVEWIDAAGNPLGQSRSDSTSPSDVQRKVAAGGVLAFTHAAVLFKRSVVLGVGGYKQEYFPAEDTELWNRIAAAGFGVLVQPEILLQYRLHSTSASMSRSADMIRKMTWIEAGIAARREGREIPSWKQFVQYRRSLRWPRRINAHRKEWGRIFYQMAIGQVASRHKIRSLPTLLAAAILCPELVIVNRLAPRVAKVAGAILRVPQPIVRGHH